MLSKDEIRFLIGNAAADCGKQLRSLRRARGLKLTTVSRETKLSIEEIDKIENWCMDTLNLESVVKLAAFYDKRLYIDFRQIDDFD